MNLPYQTVLTFCIRDARTILTLDLTLVSNVIARKFFNMQIRLAKKIARVKMASFAY